MILSLKSSKKLTTKFMSAHIKKKHFVKVISKEKFKHKRANNVDPDEVALHQPPHLDLPC